MKKDNTKKSTKTQKAKQPKTYNSYAYELKRKVVHEIMEGILTKEEALFRYGIKSRQSINLWIKKYASLNYQPNKNYGMKESPQQQIKRLRAQIEELEEEKIILNIAIDIADQEFKTHIRKKFLPQQLAKFKKHKKSADEKK